MLISSNPSGGTLMFSYICRPKAFFLVQNFEFQFFWGGGGGGGEIFFGGMKLL